MTDIKLKVKFTEGQDLETKKYTLTAEVVEYIEIPREIFVFQRTLDGIDEFQTVATIIELEKFPDTEPVHPAAFFRKHTVSLEFDTLEDRETARDIFEARIRQLVIDWAKIYPDIISEEEVEFESSTN